MSTLRSFAPLIATLLLAGVAGAQDADEDPAPSLPPPPSPQVAGSAQNLALLHDNGPYITAIGNGAGGADTSAIQSGFSTFGYGCQLSSTSDNRIADDFTVPAGETWNLTSMSWKAYQTGAPTSGTLTSANVRIWHNGSPAFGGVVLAGDTTTNRMSGTAWSGVYRVGSAGPGDISRAIMDATIDMSWAPPLTAGTYWVDVQLTGTLNSGPWANPTVPAAATDNGEQFTLAGGWLPVDDGTSGSFQDFPFTLEGTGGCGAVTTYCTAKVSSNGCVPSVSSTGNPSPGGNFTVLCSQVEQSQLGVFFHGLQGPTATPFQGGFLCVQPPVQRQPATGSGGAGVCLGSYSYNLDTLIGSLAPGTVVHGQFWFRDPGAASGTGLSNALTFATCP